MIIIDLEASGIAPDSYPIEVAWFCTETGAHDSFLIHPAFGWTHWDYNAEEFIHRISRELLRAEGIEVKEAARRLNQALHGKILFSDAGGHDQFWLGQLFEAAQEDQKFLVTDLYFYLLERGQKESISRLVAREKPHRALPDCREIARSLK